MARYKATIESTKSVEEAFAYMSDFRSVSEWDPSAVRAELLDPAPGPGARFEVRVRFAGRENDLTYRTTEFEPPNRVTLIAETSTVISEDTITVEPSGSGSAVTYDADLRLKGPLRIGDPLLGLLFKRLGDNAAEGLRRELGR